MTVEAPTLPDSLARLLEKRGCHSDLRAFLAPLLSDLSSPDLFPHMAIAVKHLRHAIDQEIPIAIYADRDVDGLTGLSILARTLRTLGGIVHWGSPLHGRGLERPVLEGLLAQGCKTVVFVDCGTGENETLEWLASLGIDAIVADHHRLSLEKPPALAWIHPGVMSDDSEEVPAGCVMAFKLSHGLWTSFLGDDAERLDYFLFSHLDVLCLGILADQVPLRGENRVLVWHGLRRLAQTRKAGLATLLRFFRLSPRTGPITVREASWQIIPLLNAAGRLGQPQWAVNLLMTEDPYVARECIDHLLALNTQRRSAQDESLNSFEQSVKDQCAVDTDPVLVALADGLEPSVTGLAAQALVRKYGRPAFLFVSQGDHCVGSARGTSDVDLFAWVEEHRDLLLKFGGHQGAVGMTLKTKDFYLLRERLLFTGQRRALQAAKALESELEIPFSEITSAWWDALQQLEPFGTGFPMPLFELTNVHSITPSRPRSMKAMILKAGVFTLTAEVEGTTQTGDGPWRVLGYPKLVKNSTIPFQWMIQEVRQHHG